MAAGLGLRAAVLFGCALSACGEPYQSTASVQSLLSNYIDLQDLQVARMADRRVASFCQGGYQLQLSKQLAREDLLLGAGGSNILLDILTNSSEDVDVVGVAMQELLQPGLLWKILPIAMSAAMLLLWLACCWTACPMCSCCRCCTSARERRTGCTAKLLAMVAVALLMMCVCISSGAAYRGYARAVSGFDNTVCASAKLLNATLLGQESPPFIGMLPAVDAFWHLDQQFNDGSPFLSSVQDLLSDTREIDSATTLASKTLVLFRDMMGTPGNMHPGSSGAADLMHRCEMCFHLLQPLDLAHKVLRGSVAVALAEARAEVGKQLAPGKRRAMQQTLRDSTAVLVKVKDMVRGAFSFFVEESMLERVKERADAPVNLVLASCLALTLLGVALAAAGCCSVCLFAFRERSHVRVREANPYRRTVHWCACCTWCCGFLYAIVAFLAGGMLIAGAVPLSSACLMLDDLNSQVLAEIAPALGMNLTDEEGNLTDKGLTVANIIDRCFSPISANPSANLLDMLNVTEGNGSMSLKDKIEQEVKGPVLSKFMLLEERLQRPSRPLAEHPEVQVLLDILAGNRADQLVLPLRQRMEEDPELRRLASDARGAGGLEVGYSTSLACEDHKVNSTLGGLNGKVLRGLEAFSQRLADFGPPVGDGCARKVDCSAGRAVGSVGAADSLAVCAAGNRFIDLKQQLLALSSYRCDLFQDPDGSDTPCDPKDMFRSEDGHWHKDCLFHDGSIAILPRTCGLQEFAQYVADYGPRIQATLRRLDESAAHMQTRIFVNMRELVEEQFIGPFDHVADGVTCGFIGGFYQEMVEGVCYEGIIGLRELGRSYVSCAVSASGLVLLTHCIWRRAVDNLHHWTCPDRGLAPRKQVAWGPQSAPQTHTAKASRVKREWRRESRVMQAYMQ